MSDEIRVSIQPDQGIKNQWARGLFYRHDGLKKTFVSKHLSVTVLILFSMVTISLLLQTPEEPKPHLRASWSTFPSELGLEDGKIQNIPTVAILDTQTRNGAPVPSYRKANGIERSAKVKFTGPQLVNRPRIAKIPPGSFVKATLLTGASNGPIRAEVIEGLNINGEPLIEEGTILLGSGQSGEDRLSIRFSQMLFKDGGFESIDAQACDGDDKIAGLKGSRVGNQALKLAGGIGLNFAGGMGAVLQDTTGINGAIIQRPTLKNALLNGAATASLEQSKEMMSDLRNKPPVIEVPEGTSIYVLFQGSR